eukprot:SAG31_NODE_178_length_21247_cov_11.492009_5_plen_98_part_00
MAWAARDEDRGGVGGARPSAPTDILAREAPASPDQQQPASPEQQQAAPEPSGPTQARSTAPEQAHGVERGGGREAARACRHQRTQALGRDRSVAKAG